MTDQIEVDFFPVNVNVHSVCTVVRCVWYTVYTPVLRLCTRHHMNVCDGVMYTWYDFLAISTDTSNIYHEK